MYPSPNWTWGDDSFTPIPLSSEISLFFQNWASGMPGHGTGPQRRCVAVSLDTNTGGGIGKWNSASCRAYFRPLCSSSVVPITSIGTTTSVPSTTTLPPKESTTIANDLIYIGESTAGEITKTFYGQRVSSSWRVARQVCASRGLEQATLENTRDQEVVNKWDSSKENGL